VVTIDSRLGNGGHMDLGRCLYGLMLAAVAEGLRGCAIGALASYSFVIRHALGLPLGERVVCGMALGFPVETALENTVRRASRLEPSGYFAANE
jgi:nitroreductase